MKLCLGDTTKSKEESSNRLENQISGPNPKQKNLRARPAFFNSGPAPYTARCRLFSRDAMLVQQLII